jgi:hypothetical protein
MDKVTGVEITSGNEIGRIYFNPHGSQFETGNIVSDGQKVIFNEKDGEVTSWAIVRGQILRYKGKDFVKETNVTNRMS